MSTDGSITSGGGAASQPKRPRKLSDAELSADRRRREEKRREEKRRDEKVTKEVLIGPFWKSVQGFEEFIDEVQDSGVYLPTEGPLATRGGAYVCGGGTYREVEDDDVPIEIITTFHAMEMEPPYIPDGKTTEDQAQVTQIAHDHLLATLPEGYRIIPVVSGMILVVSPEGKVFNVIAELMPF